MIHLYIDIRTKKTICACTCTQIVDEENYEYCNILSMNEGTGMRELDMNKLSWQRIGVSKNYKLFID